MLARVIFSLGPLTLPPWQWLARETWSKHNRGITRKRLVVTLLCVSSAKAHITLISFPLFTHKTQSQVFRASPIPVRQKSLEAKHHCFFFFFFYQSQYSAARSLIHTYMDHMSICVWWVWQINIISLWFQIEVSVTAVSDSCYWVKVKKKIMQLSQTVANKMVAT